MAVFQDGWKRKLASKYFFQILEIIEIQMDWQQISRLILNEVKWINQLPILLKSSEKPTIIFIILWDSLMF